MPTKLNLPDKKCLHCGRIFGRNSCKQVSDYRAKKFCSRECWEKYRVGENHPNWKGGIRVHSDGYLRDSHDNYIHRLVMEKHLKRKLKPNEHIHHINGNPQNNEIGNMLVLSNSQHRKLEYKIAPKNKYGQFTKK